MCSVYTCTINQGQDLFIDRCIELGKLKFLDGTDSNSTTGSHSQDKERIAENETADRNNSVASEDMGMHATQALSTKMLSQLV